MKKLAKKNIEENLEYIFFVKKLDLIKKNGKTIHLNIKFKFELIFSMKFKYYFIFK